MHDSRTFASMISQMRVVHDSGNIAFSPATRVAAKIISYLFHPLFLPVYVGLFFVYEARLFNDRTDWQNKIILLQFFVYYTFFPLVTTLLAKAVGFIQTVYLRTQKDRILLYIVCEIFYFWAWYVFRNVDFPKEVVMFALGIFLACSLGLILNSYMKISMHTIALGVICAFFLLAGMSSAANYGFYIAVAFLIAGITATARLIDSDHTQKEIYSGFFAGVLTQVIAYFFV
ncbi:MAG: hypothetical protein J7502_00330 [Flavisolibacter sp.]|nr:hypothetical protein [Flavisolibacter sp.]